MQLNAGIRRETATFLGAVFAMLCLLAPALRADDNLTLTQVVSAEYFIDVDPGEGSGTPLTPEDSSFDTDVEGIQERTHPLEQHG